MTSKQILKDDQVRSVLIASLLGAITRSAIVPVAIVPSAIVASMIVAAILLQTPALSAQDVTSASGQADATDSVGTGTVEFKPYDGKATELKLPGTVTDVLLAGEGRYLLLYLKSLRKVAVYDVNKVAIERYLPMSADAVVLAAGAEHLIVVDPDKNQIERWSLVSWDKETTRALPFTGIFKTMALGYASRGPLLVHWATGSGALDRASYNFIDLNTLQEISTIEEFRPNNTSYRDFVHIRASATGNVFGLWATSHSPQGMEALELNGNKVIQHREHSSAGHIYPSFDGRLILTGVGPCTIDMRLLDAAQRRNALMSIPTTHPSYFVSLTGISFRGDREASADLSGGIHLIPGGEQVCELKIPGLGESENESWTKDNFTIDKRVHYIVQANQILSIPFTNDRVVVTPFNLRSALSEAGVDYLFASSIPPRSCVRGKLLQYQLQVESSTDGVQLELSAAPDGMKLSQMGGITWDVPTDFADDVVFVIITMTSGDRTEFHTFRLDVEN
jgi:hypothetical protein